MAGAPKRKMKPITYITRESTRKGTLKKRMNGLVKKLEQVTTLCDIKSCAIIYTNPREIESTPTLFPNDPTKVVSVLADFMNLESHYQTKKMFDQESLLMESVNKANENLKSLQEDNRKVMLNQCAQKLLYDQSKSFDFLTTADLLEVQRLNRCYLVELNQRIQDFENDFVQVQSPMPPVPISELEQPNMVSPKNVWMNQENNVKSAQGIEQVQFDQWFAGMMKNLQPDEAGSSNSRNI